MEHGPFIVTILFVGDFPLPCYSQRRNQELYRFNPGGRWFLLRFQDASTWLRLRKDPFRWQHVAQRLWISADHTWQWNIPCRGFTDEELMIRYSVAALDHWRELGWFNSMMTDWYPHYSMLAKKPHQQDRSNLWGQPWDPGCGNSSIYIANTIPKHHLLWLIRPISFHVSWLGAPQILFFFLQLNRYFMDHPTNRK